MRISSTNLLVTINPYTPITPNSLTKRTNTYSQTGISTSVETYRDKVSFKGYYGLFNIDWDSFNVENLTPFIKTILRKVDVDTPIKEGIARKYKEQKLIGLIDEQQQFTDKFVHPFVKAATFFEGEVPVPPAILIHGAEGNAISKLVNAWTLIPKMYFSADMPVISNIQNNQFIPTVTNLVKNPVFRRQAIIVTDAENYLGMNYNQAQRLRDFDYSLEDIDILKSNENFDNINYFKSLLDRCSESRDAGGYGTTFLFTSQRPHLIHPDFRRGKLEKLEVSRPKDDKIAQSFLDILHQNSSIPPVFNAKQLEAIRLVSKTDSIKGGFSYDDLNKISAEIRYSGNENNISFIIDKLTHTPRTYTPEQIVRQNHISEIFTYKPTLYEKLRVKFETGEITQNEQNLFEELMVQNTARIEQLKQKEIKGMLNAFEKDELERLLKLEN